MEKFCFETGKSDPDAPSPALCFISKDNGLHGRQQWQMLIVCIVLIGFLDILNLVSLLPRAR